MVMFMAVNLSLDRNKV